MSGRLTALAPPGAVPIVGPWAPPPCGDESSETLLVLCLVFVRFLWGGCLDILLVLLVSGVGFFVWFGALWDLTLVSQNVCLSSLCLWLFGVFADDVFSLSLSGAGETQTPFGGFGVPLVFSPSWTRSTSSIRTSAPSPTSRLRPAPVFFVFCFFRRRRSFSGGGCSWVVEVAFGLSF